MKFSPIKASEIITSKYKRYLNTIFNIDDPDYHDQFVKELEKKETLEKGPYLDIVDSFMKGRSLNNLIEDRVIPRSFYKYNFPMDRALYYHQEESVCKCLEGRNIVVSTGTGSGKTESFLIPILSELAREDEEGCLCPGVRALIIYPMNALANDQMERLRYILDRYPEITYGSYTGQTRQERNQALNEYLKLNKGRRPKKNELICRDDMISTPPHILITNYAMLEYLMIRPKENTFFRGPYSGYWKYIILDEAHVYNGSTGIEVAMLLRRLKSSLTVKKLQYIITSATLGSEKQNKEVAEFGSRLCNSRFYPEDVIRAKRQNPKLEASQVSPKDISIYHDLALAINEEDEPLIRSVLFDRFSVDDGDLRRAVYDIVIKDQNYWNMRTLLLERPQTIYALARKLKCKPEELVDFVTVAAYSLKNDTQLLDAKYHMFIKASDSAFITLGESKKLTLNRTKSIFDGGKEYATFEIAICSFCHAIYLIGEVTIDNYFIHESMNDEINEKKILYLGNNIFDDDEDHKMKKEKMSVQEMRLCSRCGKLMHPNGIDVCEHEKKDFVTVFDIIRKETGVTKCVSCENVNHQGILRQFYTGQEATTSVLGTALFEELPSYEIKHEVLSLEDDEFFFEDDDETITRQYKEERAKQFIAFSDSRQAAAFFATYMDKTYTTILYKRLILETLKDRGFQGNIPQFVNALQARFEKFNIIRDESLSSEKESWKAVLNEMVSIYSVNSLQNLGFLKFTIFEKDSAAMNKLQLSRIDIVNIINVIFLSMMMDAAIAYDIPLNKTEKEFFTFNGHEGSFTLSDSGKKKGVSSFIPSKANCTNKRVDYIEKILAIITPGKDRAYAIKFLESIWNLLVKKGLLKSEGIEYKINVNKIQVETDTQFYKCPVCAKITPYNVRGVCPTYKCTGVLQKVDLEPTLKNNHYYRMYQDLEIRPLRIVEHTAQLNKAKAYEYQNQFKDKQIDILSCSTTFEMGVDVGSLETIFMRNMPPSPANYAQRAGRAGRSIRSVAYALTFCNKGNHDFMYFNNPEKMIRGKINPPVFKVENEKIAIRHLYASVFAYFWRQYPEYFSNARNLVEGNDDIDASGIEKLKDYLSGKPTDLLNFLRSFLPIELYNTFEIDEFGWVDRLCGEEDGILTKASNTYMYEIELLQKSLEDALKANGKVDYLRWRINNYREEGIIPFLSKKGVLPKYGFPVDTVELSILDTKNGNKLDLSLQRDLAIAISEYAPGSEVVADGNQITSQYIKKLPNMDWKEYDYIQCDCKTVNIEPHIEYDDPQHLATCKICNMQLDKFLMNSFIIPEFGFESGNIKKASLIKPKRTYRGDVSYVGYKEDAFFQHYQNENYDYEMSFTQNDEMAVLNESRFYVCHSCGYTHLSKEYGGGKKEKKHYRSNGKKCENSILRRHSLGYRFKTDVIQIRFYSPILKTYSQALSVMYGIMRGTSSYLYIEEKDIAGCVQYFRSSQNGLSGFAVILYDNTPGGSGHVKQLKDPDVLEKVLKETRNIVSKCSCGGENADTSCYNCLRSFSNQRVHEKLQRRYVIDFLEDFFKGINYKANEQMKLLVTGNQIVSNEVSFEEAFKEFLKSNQGIFDDRHEFTYRMKVQLHRFPEEVQLILELYRLKIHEMMKNVKTVDETFKSVFIKKMRNEVGCLEKEAVWAVTTWCEVYGKELLGK